VRVFDGEATVLDRDHQIRVKGGHQLRLDAAGKLKATRFNKKEYAEGDDLYRWSSLRSAYLAEANENAARIYLVDEGYGPGWIGAGWYWSPWFGAYTFIPADGYLLSPFGCGFYSPLWVYRAPVYGYNNYYHSFENFRPNVVHRGGVRPVPAFRPTFHVKEGVQPPAGRPQARGELHAAARWAASPFGLRGGDFGTFHGGGISGGLHR
jgi:hypothetical protein